MPKKRYRPGEIIAELRQAEVLLDEGKKSEVDGPNDGRGAKAWLSE